MADNIIQYYLISERDPLSGNMLFPPMCGTSLPIVPYLGRYPHSLEHYVLGADYYSLIMNYQLQSGYCFNVVYTDNFEEQISNIYNEKNIIVFFITVFSQKAANNLKKILLNNHKENVCYQPINMPNQIFESLPNFIGSHVDFFKWIDNNIVHYINLDLLKDKEPYSVPIIANNINRQVYFNPCLNNLFISECIWGNWQGLIADDSFSIQESLNIRENETESAKSNPNDFIRQQTFVRQIDEVDYALKLLYHNNSIIHPGLGVPTFFPLIIISPFNSPIIKELYEIKKEDSFEIRNNKKVFQRILESEQSENYLNSVVIDDLEDEVKKNIHIGESLSKRRMSFLDNAGYLHSSFKFSPYIRLPLIGKSIYSSLSTVGSKSGTQLIQGGKIAKIHKKVKEIGDILSEKLLSKELQEKIKNRDSQIVAISDMPFEWIQIDDIPIGFSHDICRIPETPNGGILAQYMFSKYTSLDVPENILENTLVVFGATESPFSLWQSIVVELSISLGFKTCICTSVDQLKTQINTHKPLLLIFDTHGGVDEKNKDSYILLGNERLTGDDVVKNVISAPLIFISACNTAPTYTPTNIIANAFFEVGAKAVTSTYLPLMIDTSSVTYIRLLNQLSQCSKKSIHSNWLAFTSHILRTSHIMQPFIKARNDGKDVDHKKMEEQSTLMTESMLFNNRRKIYSKIKDGIDFDGIKYSTDNVSPEYLFYSNLGRSDLICFSSWKKEYQNKLLKK